jgi:hypothetical protein
MSPEQKLNVYISNPERKKERTDAGADDREVYVAGLSKFATNTDLENLFSQVRSCMVSVHRRLLIDGSSDQSRELGSPPQNLAMQRVSHSWNLTMRSVLPIKATY